MPVGCAGGAVAIPTAPVLQDLEELRVAATIEEKELGPAAALWEPERTRMAGCYWDNFPCRVDASLTCVHEGP